MFSTKKEKISRTKRVLKRFGTKPNTNFSYKCIEERYKE